MIEGISHMTFIVKDLERTAEFFRFVFDAVEIYSSGNNTFSIAREKFFSIGDQWIAIMEGEPLSERTYNHIAFKIQEEDFEEYLERIRQSGVEFKELRSRVEGEGRSLYFYDFDNHLFELHTGTLSERLRRYSEGKG
jgi:fosfomycin resistance protein FosX